eukprot:scaffold43829_cov51-Prasinocladus_malaysianus.AAC.2
MLSAVHTRTKIGCARAQFTSVGVLLSPSRPLHSSAELSSASPAVTSPKAEDQPAAESDVGLGPSSTQVGVKPMRVPGDVGSRLPPPSAVPRKPRNKLPHPNFASRLGPAGAGKQMPATASLQDLVDLAASIEARSAAF